MAIDEFKYIENLELLINHQKYEIQRLTDENKTLNLLLGTEFKVASDQEFTEEMKKASDKMMKGAEKGCCGKKKE